MLKGFVLLIIVGVAIIGGAIFLDSLREDGHEVKDAEQEEEV